MTSHKNCTVSDVMTMTEGYGFNIILSDCNRPIVTFATREDAEQAHAE